MNRCKIVSLHCANGIDRIAVRRREIDLSVRFLNVPVPQTSLGLYSLPRQSQGWIATCRDGRASICALRILETHVPVSDVQGGRSSLFVHRHKQGQTIIECSVRVKTRSLKGVASDVQRKSRISRDIISERTDHDISFSDDSGVWKPRT